MIKLVLVGLVVVSGCVVEGDALSEIEQSARRSPGDDCPTWGCGGNSPVVAGMDLWEADETGRVRNDAGFRITDFRKLVGATWVSYRADVLDGILTARSLATGAVVYSGTQLVGARFTLVNDTTGGTYFLEVAEVGFTRFWTTPFDAFTYKLRWWSASQPKHMNVCKDPGPGVDPNGGTTINAFHAVLFDDDKFDADALQVTGERRDWFNIGCAGSALAKQFLTGNAKAAAATLGYTTTISQRTAHLKMLAADYCGMGDAFTVYGTDLSWEGASGQFSTVVPGQAVEALWTETGARCVNTPRIIASPSAASAAAFPNGLAAYLDEFGCQLPPRCSTATYTAPFAFGMSDWVSTNY